MVTTAIAGTGAASADPPAVDCPEVFAHGGYPSGANPWDRDRVRQPNNPTALRDYKSQGAVGVEADLQLTRDGHKAVMWHNETTLALTGNKMRITDLWWDTGADKLSSRTIEVGPYRGEHVHTLRQFLDALYAEGMVPLIEIKPMAEQSLLNPDPAIRDGAWKEVLDPISERIDRQEIMLYTHDAALAGELASRAHAAGLDQVIAGGPQRPVWPDTVAWEEPAPSWQGNEASWQAALDSHPRRIATSWVADLSTWLDARCG